VADDDARAGAELARAWLDGRSEMSDDLALLVSGMTQPLDEIAKAFLVTVGNAARAMAKRETRPAPSVRRKPAPPPEPTPAAPVDLNEMIRRRRERMSVRRLEEFGRSNEWARREQAEMVHGMGAGSDWGWGRKRRRMRVCSGN
jgi:hypothetical protein